MNVERVVEVKRWIDTIPEDIWEGLTTTEKNILLEFENLFGKKIQRRQTLWKKRL